MDFQAVILAAGKGSRMSDITSKCPKALLPVGQRPMVWYALNLLQNSGFKEAIIVLPALHRAEIMTQIQSNNDFKLKLTEELVHSSEETPEMGTADVLRNIIKKGDIKKDLLVISSDVISDACLDPLLALHYVRNSALTVLYTPISEGFLSSSAPGPKTKRKLEKDLVALECDSKRLMFMSSEADFEEEVTLRRRDLQCCPRFQVHSNLHDAHVYVISNSTFANWVDDNEINSIKGDLIPYLCRKQFSVAKDDGIRSKDIFSDIPEMSSWSGEINQCKTAYSCYGYVDRDSFCIRANNLAAYMYANRQMSRLWSKMTPDQVASPVHTSIQIAEKSTVGNDNFIWKNVSVGSQSVIKGCVIGDSCKIGLNVKLTNCVVMDKANIGDACVLQGTIVCREAVLQEGCHFNNCVIAVDQVVASTKSNNEIITNEARFMEI